MEIHKCEICGKNKPHSEFSKSYKKRCKSCVANIVKEKRNKSQTAKILDPSAEIIAESVLTLVECIGMFSSNQERFNNGLSPSYSDDSFFCLAYSLRDKIDSLKKK